MAAASWIQVVNEETLSQDPRNVRTLYREYGNFRGPLVVDGESVVWSAPSDDSFNYQRTYADGPLYASATGFYSIVYGRSGLEQTENEPAQRFRGRVVLDAPWQPVLRRAAAGCIGRASP
ncbi:hypothetical protein [Demequina litorisediminis]